MSKTKSRTLKITLCAILLAIYFITDRFLAINLLANQYKLSFIPVIFAAVFLGPVYGGIVGGIGDLLSSLIMPTGPYFPGFTVCAALMGVIFGLFCHKKITVPRIAVATFINQGIVAMILNTINLAFYFIINNIGKYGNNVFKIFGALFLSRSIQAGIYFVAEVALLLIFMKTAPLIKNELKKIGI